jgi:hypothetical protein
MHPGSGSGGNTGGALLGNVGSEQLRIYASRPDAENNVDLALSRHRIRAPTQSAAGSGETG